MLQNLEEILDPNVILTIKKGLEQAKDGHICKNPECLICTSVAIITNTNTDEVMELLAEVICFCYHYKKEIANEGGVSLTVDVEVKGDITVEEFQKLVREDEAKSRQEEIIEKWVLLAKETGRDLESINALLKLYYLIRAIIQTIQELQSFIAQKKAREVSLRTS